MDEFRQLAFAIGQDVAPYEADMFHPRHMADDMGRHTRDVEKADSP